MLNIIDSPFTLRTDTELPTEEGNRHMLKEILVEVDEELYEFFLQEIFPAVPYETVSRVLSEQNGDMVNAISALLSLESVDPEFSKRTHSLVSTHPQRDFPRSSLRMRPGTL